MKTIIAGSRTIENYNLIKEATRDCGWKITEVVCGMAKGVDSLGMRWAQEKKIPVAQFPAKWTEFGTRAGYLRNVEMSKYADCLILIWDGESRGSKMMKDIAEKKGMKIWELKL